MTIRKKLIEVALPLDAINKASAREKSIRHGHPSTLHLWWARRPLAAARAVIFAQMVDDPSAHPDLFPTPQKQEKERLRLFKIIEDLVQWENTTNETVLQQARDEIWQSWRRACAENADHPRAKELFDRQKLPAFHDPFAGGGALPLEAQRLGLEAYASDLNPVAVLINKAMIEIPPRFAGRPPVNPDARKEKTLLAREWRGAQGLAEDVRYYGKWMRDEAAKRIGHLYPKVEISSEMTQDRPDLKLLVGRKLTVLAWLWARTVPCPNPACVREMPLLSSLVLSSKTGKEAYLQPVIKDGHISFAVGGIPSSATPDPKKGYKRGMSGIFECASCGSVTKRSYVAEYASERGLGSVQTAVVAEGDQRRTYLPADSSPVPTATGAVDATGLDIEFAPNPRDVWCRNFGLHRPIDLFTARQLATLATVSDLVREVRERVERDALVAGLTLESGSLEVGGDGAAAYADGVSTYVGFVVEKLAESLSTLCTWSSAPKNELVVSTFRRQALPMTWDFAEANPFADSSGSLTRTTEAVARVLAVSLSTASDGHAYQADATRQNLSQDKVISADPPYYDNISYADLSDFFYVWMRRALKPIFPSLFATLTAPKDAELVATAYRHGSAEKAEAFFLHGMTEAMQRLSQQAHPAFPVTIYYAFKQAESASAAGAASTGWEVFLGAVIGAGFEVSGTWPVRTEREGRSTGIATNALASSIVLVCRPRATHAPTTTRREFVTALKAELPQALAHLQRGNIAPVDLAQAAIGPGMAVYTRYTKVLDAEGKPLSVREALALINQTLDEALAEQEGDFDADSRWALTWFEQSGFAEGEYGVAEQLSKSKNTSVKGMEDAGILASSRGKVRLLRPSELPADWDPAKDARRNDWEIVHHLIRLLEGDGEAAAAALVAKIGTKAEIARELAYRLYTLCERKKRAPEALSYNGLVQSWPEITRLSREDLDPQPGGQIGLGFDTE